MVKEGLMKKLLVLTSLFFCAIKINSSNGICFPATVITTESAETCAFPVIQAKLICLTVNP